MESLSLFHPDGLHFFRILYGTLFSALETTSFALASNHDLQCSRVVFHATGLPFIRIDLEVVATLETTQGVVLDRDYKSVS